MDISVVVPLLNEAESLPELEAWIRRVMEEHQFSYEIVFVDDGSTDNSWSIIQGLAEKNPNVKALRFRRNYGKSPALNEGFKIVQGDVVITMDADLQDSPDEIPELYKMIKEDGYDLVSGWKKVRYDDCQKHSVEVLQLDHAQDVGHQAARLQLRFEGLSQRGGEEHPGVW